MLPVLAAAFAFAVPSPTPAPTLAQTVESWTATRTCARIGRPLLYAMQLTDLILMDRNMRANAAQGTQSVELDPVTRLFMGGRNANRLGGAAALVTYDLLGAALTRRSNALRCAFEVREIMTEAETIRSNLTPRIGHP